MPLLARASACVVLLWACEINLLKAVSQWDSCLDAVNATHPAPRDCPWSNPLYVGVVLKMIFVIVLPPALLARWSLRRGTERARWPLVDRRFFVLSGALSLFLLGASVTWVASIPLTLAAINTALYQLYTPLTYVFSIPILREGLSASKSLGVVVALASVLNGKRHDELRRVLDARCNLSSDERRAKYANTDQPPAPTTTILKHAKPPSS